MNRLEELLVRDNMCSVLVNGELRVPAVARILECPVSDLPACLPDELVVQTPKGPVTVVNIDIPTGLPVEQHMTLVNAAREKVQKLPRLADLHNLTFLVIQGYTSIEGTHPPRVRSIGAAAAIFLSKRSVLVHDNGKQATLLRDISAPTVGSFDIEPLL